MEIKIKLKESFLFVCSLIVLITSMYFLKQEIAFLFNSKLANGTILSNIYDPAMPSRICFNRYLNRISISFVDFQNNKRILTKNYHSCGIDDIRVPNKSIKVIYSSINVEKAYIFVDKFKELIINLVYPLGSFFVGTISILRMIRKK